MTDKDIAIGVTAGFPTMGAMVKKPAHLILIEDGKKVRKFISLDKPENLNGLIQVKGIFSELPEEDINKSFYDLLTNSPKELILEMLFPIHRVISIRNLVFKAK